MHPPKLGSLEGSDSRAVPSRSPQVEGSPSLRWQMALYRGVPGREEDADDPEKIVRRVQEVSAVLYHLDQVGEGLGLWAGPAGGGRSFAWTLLGIWGKGQVWHSIGTRVRPPEDAWSQCGGAHVSFDCLAPKRSFPEAVGAMAGI